MNVTEMISATFAAVAALVAVYSFVTSFQTTRYSRSREEMVERFSILRNEMFEIKHQHETALERLHNAVEYQLANFDAQQDL